MKELFQLLPELNRRLFQRVLEFFAHVGEEAENNVSLSYLSYLLGPILFYDRVEGDEEDGEQVQLQYDGEIVFDMLMQLFQFHSQLFPTPLKEQTHWDTSRKSDLESRRNSSAELGDTETSKQKEEKLEGTGETSKPLTTGTTPQRRRKRDVLKGLSIAKLKKQYNGELEELPPSINAIPVNYTVPAR
mmetsp:Transcript_15410/g.19605  ORF Transcript_15410/g.19605 Transcript_15410/m.19605 type:complete len:188 (-) Transcript_15410:56-619(-)